MSPKPSNTRNSLRETSPVVETTEQFIERRVAEALAQYKASRNLEIVVYNSETTPASSANNKRKWNSEGDPHAYALVSNPKPKSYLGNRPKCGKCGKHHEGDCFFCDKCQRHGHRTQACRTHPINKEQRNTGCFRCGDTGHYQNQCPTLNNANNNQNNNNRNANIPHAPGRAYVLRAPDAQPDPYGNNGTF